MKCYHRDYKPMTIWFFAKLGASFQVTVSLVLWPRAVWPFPSQSFPNRPFLTTAFCSSTWQCTQHEDTLGFLGAWLEKQVKSSICLHQRLRSLNANMKTSFTRLWGDHGFPENSKSHVGKGSSSLKMSWRCPAQVLCFPWDPSQRSLSPKL